MQHCQIQPYADVIVPDSTPVAVVMDLPCGCGVRVEAEETVENDFVLCEVRDEADETAG